MLDPAERMNGDRDIFAQVASGYTLVHIAGGTSTVPPRGPKSNPGRSQAGGAVPPENNSDQGE